MMANAIAALCAASFALPSILVAAAMLLRRRGPA